MNPDAEDQFEKLMKKAYKEPAYRPEFYRVLLESTIYVISYTGLPDSRECYLTPGDKLSLLAVPVADDVTVIPFFSSPDRLMDFIQDDGEWTSLNARHFFTLTRGNILLLNPGSDLSKSFEPKEIDALLEAGVYPAFKPGDVPWQPCRVIGPPEPYPSRMIDALTTFLATRPQVKAAYVAMGRQDGDIKPHLVLGIDAEDDVRSLMQQTVAVAVDTATGPYSGLGIVNMRRKGDDTVAGLKRLGRQFYDRQWGARLSTTIGNA